MGILTVYFTAPDDESAIETIDWPSGPDVRDEKIAKSPYMGAEMEYDAGQQLILISDFENGIDGNCQGEDCGKELADRDNGERAVIRLSKDLRDTLALLDDDPDAVAESGVLEDFADVDDILEYGYEVVLVAKAAKEKGWPLYFWVSL